MRNIRIYQAGQFTPGQRLALDKPASHHLLRVLRLKQQQVIFIFDGRGNEYQAELSIDGKTAIAHITDALHSNNESPLKIHLLQGISKGERMDFAIQKSIELGVHEITPVSCERTVVNLKAERMQKKLDHWKGVAVSACEQSGRSYLPSIHPTLTFADAINNISADIKLTLDPTSPTSLKQVQASQDNTIALLIGPEGGLSATEIHSAKDQGFKGVSLGPRILRTETAALAAISALQLQFGDLA